MNIEREKNARQVEKIINPELIAKSKILTFLPSYYREMGNNPTYQIIELFRVKDHEVAWMEYKGHIEYDIMKLGREGEEYTGRSLSCEGSFKKNVGWRIKGEQKYNLGHEENCKAIESVVDQKHEEIKLELINQYKETEKPNLEDHLEEIIFNLIQRGKDGQFLEQSDGAEFWGGYYYLQTLQEITGTNWDKIWKTVDRLKAEKKIRMEGNVVQEYPRNKKEANESENSEEIIKPLAKWDDDESKNSKLVWWSKLDDRYQVEVQRVGQGDTDSYKGTLFIFDHKESDKLLFMQTVGLSYGAALGADIDDVCEWQEKAVGFIDGMSGGTNA